MYNIAHNYQRLQSVVDSGEGPWSLHPLFFDQNEARKKFFDPPYLRVLMTAPPPPPPYFEGLDPPLTMSKKQRKSVSVELLLRGCSPYWYVSVALTNRTNVMLTVCHISHLHLVTYPLWNGV